MVDKTERHERQKPLQQQKTGIRQTTKTKQRDKYTLEKIASAVLQPGCRQRFIPRRSNGRGRQERRYPPRRPRQPLLQPDRRRRHTQRQPHPRGHQLDISPSRLLHSGPERRGEQRRGQRPPNINVRLQHPATEPGLCARYVGGA